jgi:ABC-type antimicrobial peptide transport system permease subunit
MVWPGYLQTMRIPLLRGRDLAETDTKDSPLVCVIDRLLADRFFPGEDPIGREISMYRGAARIVGIAAAVRATSQEEGSRPTVYYALRQVPFFANAGVVVRSAIPAAGAIRQAVREAGPGAPVYDLKTMDERIGQTLGVRRVVVALLTAFAALSLLLAMVGVHGVLAQVVGERRGEIGIRMALGARPGQILAHYLGMGVRLGAVGALAGMVVAAGAARLVDSFLFRTKALDPVMFALAVAGLALAVIVAAGWPALRAARVAPQEALRYE